MKTLFCCFLASCGRSQKLCLFPDLLYGLFFFSLEIWRIFCLSVCLRCSEILQGDTWVQVYFNSLCRTLLIWKLMLSSSGKFSQIISSIIPSLLCSLFILSGTPVVWVLDFQDQASNFLIFSLVFAISFCLWGLHSGRFSPHHLPKFLWIKNKSLISCL